MQMKKVNDNLLFGSVLLKETYVFVNWLCPKIFKPPTKYKFQEI